MVGIEKGPEGQNDSKNHAEMVQKLAEATQEPVHGVNAPSPIEQRGQRPEIEDVRKKISDMPDKPSFTNNVDYGGDSIHDANMGTDILAEDSKTNADSARLKQDRRIEKGDRKLRYLLATPFVIAAGWVGLKLGDKMVDVDNSIVPPAQANPNTTSNTADTKSYQVGNETYKSTVPSSNVENNQEGKG